MGFHANIRLPAERDRLETIRRFIEQQAGRAGASQEEVDDLVQAVDEAAANIIIHGYQDGAGEIEVDLVHAPGRITVTLRDTAPPFDPTGVPSPDLALPLWERQAGGLGVHFIRLFVDEFSHAALPRGGNELKMVKYLKSDNGGRE